MNIGARQLGTMRASGDATGLSVVVWYMCSIIHYGNINKDTIYLYVTVLYYLHYTHYSICC